jgi:hypothetical protein
MGIDPTIMIVGRASAAAALLSQRRPIVVGVPILGV